MLLRSHGWIFLHTTLPVTFYQSVDQLPPFNDYDMAGRTYRYFAGKPLYPFGYGLSYTSFAYSALQAPDETRIGEPLKVSVDVSNTGPRSGEEVVELYVRLLPSNAGDTAPTWSLAGFERIALERGETKHLDFTLAPRQLALFRDGRWIVPEGAVEISVGGQLPGVEGTAAPPTTGVAVGTVKLGGSSKVLD